MVSFKNGILKISSDRSEKMFRLPYEICLFLGIAGLYLFSYSWLHFLFVGISILGTVLITLGRVLRSKVNHVAFGLWYLSFFVLAHLSTLWEFSASSVSVAYMKAMLYTLVLSFGVTQYITSKRDLDRALSIYVYSCVVIALAQFASTPIGNWFSGGFSEAISTSNANFFGMIMLMAALISFYHAYTNGRKKWYALALFMLFCCLLSNSRKAVLVCVIGLLLVILFSDLHKGHILHTAVFSVAIIVFVFLLTQTDLSIGQKIENMIQYNIFGEDVNEGSLPMREFYITFAKQLFREKPILGHGYANFATLLYSKTNVSRAVYAHNNYYEILADLGLVGFIIYYSIHAYILIKLIIRWVLNRRSKTLVIGITLICAKLLCDHADVSMYNSIYHFILAIAYTCTYIDDMPTERSYYYGGEPVTAGKRSK